MYSEQRISCREARVGGAVACRLFTPVALRHRQHHALIFPDVGFLPFTRYKFAVYSLLSNLSHSTPRKLRIHLHSLLS